MRSGLKPSEFGLRVKIILRIIIFIFVMALCILYFFDYIMKKTLLSDNIKWGRSLAQNLAYDVEYGVLVEDAKVLDSLLANVAKEKDILGIRIFNSIGNIITSLKDQNFNGISLSLTGSKVFSSFIDNEDNFLLLNIKKNNFHIIASIKTDAEKSFNFDTFEEKSIENKPPSNSSKKEVIGYILMKISLVEAINKLKHARDLGILIIGIISLIFSFLLFRFINSSITDPIQLFVKNAAIISSGNYDQRINVSSNDEIGQLAKTFNDMTQNIKISHKKISNYAELLKEKVNSRTAELENRNRELALAHKNILAREQKLKDTQSHLVLSEKMASLGVMIAGIAHELNTPIGAIKNASEQLPEKVTILTSCIDEIGNLTENERSLLNMCLNEFLNSEKIFNNNNSKIPSWKESQKMRKFLIESGFENFQELTSLLVRFNIFDSNKVIIYKPLLTKKNILNFLEAAGTIYQAQIIFDISSKKIIEIINALKYYAYTDKDELSPININESIEKVTILMHNKFKNKFDVIKNFTPLPEIYCSSEINQVWTNLLSNSFDAMDRGEDETGKIYIETKNIPNSKTIKVIIKDNGSGITKKDIGKIFDPFYTTKGIGKGTGLGLSIASGIIKRHNGKMNVHSIPGNTTFTISLPWRSKNEST